MDREIFNRRLKMLVLMPLYHTRANATQFTDIYSQNMFPNLSLNFHNLGFIFWRELNVLQNMKPIIGRYI